jgi:hypothetical protein
MYKRLHFGWYARANMACHCNHISYNWSVCSYDLLYIPFCSLLQLNLFWKPCSGLGGVDIHTLENSPLPLIFHMWWEFLASKNITESDNMAHNRSKFIMTITKQHAHLEHILYYSLSGLNPCSRVSLERLTVTQQMKTFRDFHGLWRSSWRVLSFGMLLHVVW